MSRFISIFDPTKHWGIYRMGNRANEGYAEMTVMIFLADGSVLFNYKNPR